MKNTVIDFTDKLSSESSQTDQITREETHQVVTFKMQQEHYAIAVDKAREIIAHTTLYRVPSAPEFVLGVTNLRGKVIPVIDLSRVLGVSEAMMQKNEQKIIIVDHHTRRVGLLVDQITQIQKFLVSEIVAPPPEVQKDNPFIVAIVKNQSNIVFLLDVDQLLSHIK